jgi:hypothetical protein
MAFSIDVRCRRSGVVRLCGGARHTQVWTGPRAGAIWNASLRISEWRRRRNGAHHRGLSPDACTEPAPPAREFGAAGSDWVFASCKRDASGNDDSAYSRMVSPACCRFIFHARRECAQQVGGVWPGRIVSGKCPSCETIPSAHTRAQLASLSHRHRSLAGCDLLVTLSGFGVREAHFRWEANESLRRGYRIDHRLGRPWECARSRSAKFTFLRKKEDPRTRGGHSVLSLDRSRAKAANAQSKAPLRH